MLNDRHRAGLRRNRALPASRRWAAFTTGILRLPATEVRGGWAAGWYDWFPWRIESFDALGEFATIRSLTDSRVVKRIHRRQLEAFEEIAPFGRVERSRAVLYDRPWHRPYKKKPRYV